jgi:hypothetical protein
VALTATIIDQRVTADLQNAESAPSRAVSRAARQRSGRRSSSGATPAVTRTILTRIPRPLQPFWLPLRSRSSSTSPDPRTGIPGTEKWLPSVAAVKQACIKRQAYLDRLEDFDRRFGNRPSVTTLLTFDKTRPGRRANVFVPADAPQYARLLEALKTADPADWKLDEAERPGVWVARGLVCFLSEAAADRGDGKEREIAKEKEKHHGTETGPKSVVRVSTISTSPLNLPH